MNVTYYFHVLWNSAKDCVVNFTRALLWKLNTAILYWSQWENLKPLTQKYKIVRTACLIISRITCNYPMEAELDKIFENKTYFKFHCYMRLANIIAISRAVVLISCKNLYAPIWMYRDKGIAWSVTTTLLYKVRSSHASPYCSPPQNWNCVQSAPFCYMHTLVNIQDNQWVTNGWSLWWCKRCMCLLTARYSPWQSSSVKSDYVTQGTW